MHTVQVETSLPGRKAESVIFRRDDHEVWWKLIAMVSYGECIVLFLTEEN